MNKIAAFHFNDKNTDKFLRDFYNNLRKYVDQKKINLFIIGNILDETGSLAEESFFF